MKKRIKNILKSVVYAKERTLLIKNYYLGNKKLEEIQEYKKTKKVLFCLTPNYGNMGDQAIAYATKKFFEENFKDYGFLQFERDEFYSYAKSIKKIVNEDDIIAIQGGGNMGNLYLREEHARRLVIKKFDECKVVSMPTTLSFTNDKVGDKHLRQMKKIYNKNNKLMLLAREEKTFSMMQEIFNVKSFKVPDIVFYLENIFKVNSNRNNIMVCLRSDKESYWKNKKDNFIVNLKLKYDNVVETDTVVDREIDSNRREEELFNMWNEFRNSKVVITDRLHGMIFAFITKTPCIILRSADHKIIESYKWIEGINYMRFVKELEFNTINNEIEELINLTTFDETNFKEEYFNKLVRLIKEK
ncbi:polysaccharide pyruvyl transferase family protein [Clostridium sp. CM027]|uniref:polysaccharide pyruvyl transferase family protein n=1 Tax=Clostridium sp. CM027 TaxID=2849865 RepID=UPI001C6F4D40|nr:polysaccharide pyruvyl transferase family protein [Clostridium sp. CM027]MBW9145263.1 polysaccharide pyruvyl transferase family protein [Clostridium sp. CM027]UVE40394.1 polysaccharide pyruvyl transferase family protein [Clostridium sp. CM027]